MRRLLLSLTALLLTIISFSQVPANDLIENATELVSLNYSETNIRLDLAAINQGQQVGCSTNGFSSVYYKFTATETTFINASIIASATGGGIVNSFVIAYTAPNLNVTSTNQLTVVPASPCQFGAETVFEVVNGQSYYIVVHRSDPNALTRFTSTEEPDVPESERTALIDFYNATGGDNWINNSNWDTSTPVDTWYGVSTTTTALSGQPFEDGEEHVWGINFFQNNNLTGTLPTELGALTKLRTIIIRDGSLTGNIPEVVYDLPDMLQIQLFNLPMSGAISPNVQNLSNLQVLDIRGSNFSGPLPDLTGFNLQWLIIQGNSFQFGDFETQLQTYQSTIDNFSYTPQKQLNPKPDILTSNGENVSVSAEVSGAQNNYEWYKRNTDASVTLVGSEETLEFVFDASIEGAYFLRVTSTIVPNLVLTTPDFTIRQDPTLSPDYDTLLDLYNSTNGAGWANNTNWLNPNAPLNQWFGVVSQNNHVTQINLNFNNLTGEIPTSIANFTELTSLLLGSNMLEGNLIDFSALSNIETIDITRNNFDFIDFETNINTNTTITAFNYSPQNFKDNPEVIDAVIGEDYSFIMSPVEGTEVEYQWHRGSQFVIDDVIVDGATTNMINFENLQSEDLDAYSCFVTSTLIPDLIIKRSTVELKGEVSPQERDALIAIYNATGGPAWSDNTNWLSSEPVSTWSGVTTIGNKVTTLIFFGTGLNGTLPPEIGDLVNLEVINISLNTQLVGVIPSEIGNLANLRYLLLQHNNHTGSIPVTIGNLTNLRQLRLLWNDLSGPIPATIGNLSNLDFLELDGGNGNNLSGELPIELGNLSNLGTLSVGNNNFEGILPTSLGNLVNLEYIAIANNSFEGELPFNSPNALIDISNNHFDFSDIEPFEQAGNYSTLIYSPQRTEDIAENIESGVGVDITLNVNDTNIDRDANDTAMNNEYQWYKDNVAITGSNSANYTITNTQVSDSGDYFCEITNSILPDLTIVRAPITVLIDPSLSVIDTEIDNEISIYPNPTKNWLNIKSDALTDAKLSIYDINGRLVITQNLEGNLNALNVEQLQSGTYIIKIEDHNKVQTKRFIKQ